MVKLEPAASASLFVRINVPLVTTVPPVKLLRAAEDQRARIVSSSDAVPDVLSLMLPEIVSVEPAVGAIVRLPARATLAAIVWLPLP